MVRFNVLVVAASTACLAVSCGSALAAESAVKSAPARVEATLDAKIMKVTLTPKAAERLGVVIDTIKGDNVYLSDGPPTGTKVLAAGVPQVYGAEVKVGH